MSETPHLSRLGASLKGLRLQRAMTLDKLAGAAGVSAGLLSQLERGIGNPSLVTLMNIADALEVPVGILFREADDSNGIVVREEERQGLITDAPDLTVELLSSDLGYPIQFLWIERAPGESTEHRPSSHKGAEFGVVIQGTLEVHLGDEVHVLEEGDSINFHSDVSHWYRNPGDESVVYVCAIASPLSRELGVVP